MQKNKVLLAAIIDNETNQMSKNYCTHILRWPIMNPYFINSIYSMIGLHNNVNHFAT